MSTAASGKREEKRLARELNELGWLAERVPRSVCAATPSKIDDVIAVPPGTAAQVPEPGNEHRPLTEAVQSKALEASAVDTIEVKYTSGSAYGCKGIYKAHLETVGLGTLRALQWDCGHLTGGVAAWCAYQLGGPHEKIPFLPDPDDSTTLAKTAARLLKPETVDAAAIRLSGHPFVMVWR